jgi:hypothetical protein
MNKTCTQCASIGVESKVHAPGESHKQGLYPMTVGFDAGSCKMPATQLYQQ